MTTTLISEAALPLSQREITSHLQYGPQTGTMAQQNLLWQLPRSLGPSERAPCPAVPLPLSPTGPQPRSLPDAVSCGVDNTDQLLSVCTHTTARQRPSHADGGTGGRPKCFKPQQGEEQ